MKNDKEKRGNLAVYAIIMILMAVIVIVVAAMADNREKSFQNQINEKTQTNLSISDEIVSLKDENYKLNQQNENLKSEIEIRKEFNKTILAALELYKENKISEAAEKISTIEVSKLPEDSAKLLSSLESAFMASTMP